MAAATTTTATTITTTAPGANPPPVAAPTAPFNFAQYLLEANAHRGDKIAYIDDQGALRYGELAEGVRRFATALQAIGVRREERVLLLMHDCSDWPVCFLGAIYAGIVPVAVNTLLTADDYAYMLQHSRARAALVSATLLPVLEQAMAKAMAEGGHEVDHVIVSRPEGALPADTIPLDTLIADHAPQAAAAATGPDDPGFWLYSSGSTGRPKGVLHSQANPYWTAELYAKPILGLTEDDICFSAAKLYFAYGLGNGLTFPLSVGATVVLMAERPTPEAIFRRWLDHRATVFFGAPTGYAGMLASPALPAREQVALRLCSSAGEALPAELGQRFTAHFGCEIIDGIGSTEMLHIFLSNRPGQVRYGTTGWPVPGYTIELRDEEGRPVPDGEVGDLYIQGPSSALMYWGNRDKSRETFQGSWTRSGDKYVRNADGTYCYAGRSDDMLKVSGIYVSPFEVEGTLMQHPAVLEAAVIGVNDAQGLTRSKAFVVLKPGMHCDEAELKAFVKERLAPYKYPRLIEFVDSLPKTATGKIQRFRLREREQEQQQQQKEHQQEHQQGSEPDAGVASNVLLSPDGQLALAGLQ
ncbi:benzoate-CoA ligase family protein [Cupriavidus gilardii]|uniref:benzoate-CoA ligase family protein n=1 Tax=Cupriavidus gilardii TaxID=82541 RepID=UPI0020C7026D|nr:benzoate-CoA ligase family protein [Cupriavidus gilardii]